MFISPLTTKIIFTSLVVIIAFLLKILLLQYIGKNPWKIYFKNLVNTICLILLFFIWQQEIREFSFSIIAIAAALAIATKEFILCFVGGAYKLSNHFFKIGDRIEVGDNLGDVIDNTLFYTKLLEVGPKGLSQQYTGRIVFVPNSILLTQSVNNLTSSKAYSFHVFKHPIELSPNILRHKKLMYHAALYVCTPYLSEARFEMQNTASKEGLEPPEVGPVVSLHFTSAKEINLLIRVPVPVKMRGHYQQKILHRYLEKLGYPRRKKIVTKTPVLIERSNT